MWRITIWADDSQTRSVRRGVLFGTQPEATTQAEEWLRRYHGKDYTLQTKVQ